MAKRHDVANRHGVAISYTCLCIDTTWTNTRPEAACYAENNGQEQQIIRVDCNNLVRQYFFAEQRRIYLYPV